MTQSLPVPLVAVDFHGVICAHPEGSRGLTEPEWPEVPGAIEWLKAAAARWRIVIVSARFSRPGIEGANALSLARHWLKLRGVPIDWMIPGEDGEPQRIAFSAYKPPCHLWIDDRAWAFAGRFPTDAEIESFKPWNR